MEEVYGLFSFLFSKENMQESHQTGKLTENSKDLEKTLHDVDSEDLISIAFRLLPTLLVTLASGERSFSALKLIKTYLRSTMSQDRLSCSYLNRAQCVEIIGS